MGARSHPLEYRMARLFLPLALIATLALTPGCVAVVAGAAAAGTMSYASNESARSFPATMDATWTASLEALREVGYPVDPSVPYQAGRDEFEMDDVEVQLSSDGKGTTRVFVRVGTFDNKKNREKARKILDAIEKRVGLPATN